MADPKGRSIESIQIGEKWIFTWHNENGEHFEHEAKDQAKPELVEAFNDLKHHAAGASPHLDPQYHVKTHVYKWKSDWKNNKRKNVVILYTVDTENGSVKGQSMKMLADEEQEEAKLGRWPKSSIEHFELVERLAFAYIDGDRAEPELPLIQKDDKADGQESLEFNDEEQTAAAESLRPQSD